MPTKTLVIIHGAGRVPSNFYKEPLASLTALLGAEPPCQPCWYGNLSNVGPAVRGRAPVLTPEARRFQEGLRDMLAQRTKAIAATQTRDKRRAKDLESIFLAADLIRDVTGYFLGDPQFQQKVQRKLRGILSKAAAQFDETVLVSHSLGTVIAFDVMRQWADEFKVSKFYTTGCPLLKAIVLGARTGDVGRISLATVPYWGNVFDTTDPVADPISPRIPAYPVDDIFVQVADAPIPSHDYWRNARVLRMFADALAP